MIHDIGKSNSLLNQFIAELRDENIQKDSMRFRRNLERIGEIFAYEISKTLNYSEEEITTPLGISNVPTLSKQPVIATILRAGLPLHNGLLNYFDKAENAFISAFRKHQQDGEFEIALEYASSPELIGKTLIISDPMLASGSSMVITYKELMKFGKPEHVHIVAVIASTQGIDYLKRHLPTDDFTLWVAAVDQELTAQAYIVPGLGDAGDLAFGPKLD